MRDPSRTAWALATLWVSVQAVPKSTSQPQRLLPPVPVAPWSLWPQPDSLRNHDRPSGSLAPRTQHSGLQAALAWGSQLFNHPLGVQVGGTHYEEPMRLLDLARCAGAQGIQGLTCSSRAGAPAQRARGKPAPGRHHETRARRVAVCLREWPGSPAKPGGGGSALTARPPWGLWGTGNRARELKH